MYTQCVCAILLFIHALSTPQIVQGAGRMLVVAVGPNSQWGAVKATLQAPSDETPLQEKLTALAERIGLAGTICAGLVFVRTTSDTFCESTTHNTQVALFVSFVCFCVYVVCRRVCDASGTKCNLFPVHSTRHLDREELHTQPHQVEVEPIARGAQLPYLGFLRQPTETPLCR